MEEVPNMCATNSAVGKRVRLINSGKTSIPVKPGNTGTIWRVTPIGTVRVIWDNGIQFDLDPKTDRWEVLVNGAHTDNSEHKAEKR